MINQQKGLAPLIIVAIVAVVLAVVGVGGYFGYQALQNAPAEAPDTLEESTEQVEISDSVDLPELFGEVDITGTGLSSGQIPAFGVSGDFDLSVGEFDFSGLSGIGVELSPPEPSVDAPPVPDLMPSDFDFSGMAGQFAAQQQQQAPPSGTPTEQPPSEPPANEPPPEPPPQSQVNAGNCAQFSSMPSASYCSAVGDPNGIQLCQDCKAAGY